LSIVDGPEEGTRAEFAEMQKERKISIGEGCNVVLCPTIIESRPNYLASKNPAISWRL
jgi:hypothetical protein